MKVKPCLGWRLGRSCVNFYEEFRRAETGSYGRNFATKARDYAGERAPGFQTAFSRDIVENKCDISSVLGGTPVHEPMKKASGNGSKPTRLGPLLRRASQSADAALAKALEDFYPLTPRQYDLLDAIGSSTRTQGQLASLTGVDRSTMSDVLRRLEAQKLLRRPYSRSDSRVRHVSLTSSGAELLAKVSKAVRDAEEEFETLVGNQLPMVARALENLCRASDEEDAR